MSQGSFQQQPRAFAPALQTHTSDNYLPPAKRPRIDSAPSSPYTSAPQSPFATSPSFSNIALPNGYNPQRQLNGLPVTPQSSVAQKSGVGVMGPPQRPADRPAERQEEKQERHLDVNELSDLVTASGIDLREEENYLANSYRGDRNNASFNSLTTSTQSSFDLLSQNSFGAIGSQRASSSFQSDPGLTVEQGIYEKHRKAARAVNESQQYHLESPFLWGNVVRHRIEKIATDNGVRVPLEGLFDRVQPDKPQTITGTSMTGADGSSIVAAVAPALLNRGTPIEPILCLLSLAANERVRGLLEDAYGLARGRQYSSDGVVPPEWSDLAVAEGAQPTRVVPNSTSQTSWDAVHDTDGQGDGKEEQQALPSPPNSNPDGVQRELAMVSTVAITTPTLSVRSLTDLGRRERAAEEARRKMRSARAAKKAAQAAAAATSTPDSADGQSTPTGDGKKLPPGMLGERAPEVKMTKKEREKLAKQDMSDEVATRNANTTASLQLAGMGKSYSWMKSGGGAGSKSLGPGRQPGKPGSNAATATAGVVAKVHPEGWPADDRKFGEWKEDSVGARGIEMRDWIAVLEEDGSERTTLGWAWTKMNEGALQGQGQAGQGQGQT